MPEQDPPALDWQWQQTMLRVKDPAVSVAFYQEHFGLTLLAVLACPKLQFDLYFLASLPKGQRYELDPRSPQALELLWSGEYGGHRSATLELTHNYGTQDQEGPVYHPGNHMEDKVLGVPGRDGFGHIAFNTHDVDKVCAELEDKGVVFKKRPNEGRMPGLAFVLDPDGYWVEIVGRKGYAPQIENTFNLSQTMLRVKDPAKSLAFYQKLGMTLIRKSPGSDFCNYFLASLTQAQQKALETKRAHVQGQGPDAIQEVERAFLKSLFIPTLELTHNAGTEHQSDFRYYSGNQARSDSGSDGRGFGHIGFLVDDLDAACKQLDHMGYGFKKRPNEGAMQGVAFALDPDGYWVEVLQRGAGDKMPLR